MSRKAMQLWLKSHFTFKQTVFLWKQFIANLLAASRMHSIHLNELFIYKKFFFLLQKFIVKAFSENSMKTLWKQCSPLEMWTCREFVALWTLCFEIDLTIFGKSFLTFLQIPWHSMHRLKSFTFEFVQHNIFEVVSSFYICSALIASIAIASRSHMNRPHKWNDYYASIYLVSLKKVLCVCLKKRCERHQMQFVLIPCGECVLGSFFPLIRQSVYLRTSKSVFLADALIMWKIAKSFLWFWHANALRIAKKHPFGIFAWQDKTTIVFFSFFLLQKRICVSKIRCFFIFFVVHWNCVKHERIHMFYECNNHFSCTRVKVCNHKK